MVIVTLKIQMFVNEINGIVTWLAQIPDFLFNQNNIIVRGAKKTKGYLRLYSNCYEVLLLRFCIMHI